MTLVAGVDSSTQSCKVVVADAETGEITRVGQAPHPDGTEADPAAWLAALDEALHAAGGLDDVAALGVAGQQHGMVCLSGDGEVVRPALLWNDTRSAGAADDLVAELGGPGKWAEAVGSVPVASFTVTKLRWLASHEPEAAARTASVCLPHDYLTWKLTGAFTTDRGDASGTGYWSPADDGYRTDLLELAMGRAPALPRVLAPAEPAGRTASGVLVSAGTGDNMGAALGLGIRPGDVVVSLGTSGTVFTVAERSCADPSGEVAGFADATGRFLPLVCTLNAARVLDAATRLLGVDHEELSRLALSAPPGADGLTLVPYLEGERTPNRPDATGAVHGLRLDNATPAHLARAAIEGMLCGLADGLESLLRQGVRADRVLLIGGAARSDAVRRIAPTVFGRPVLVPPAGEYVAEGAAVQAAWALSETPEPPRWERPGLTTYEADPYPALRERYAEARDRVLDR
ncbi:xylulokinase [Actinoallomurus iriomotensis]|uniref:Xylulose kinase n=1 Tax=Actinoallomurus iriomotensis TaxID=478107 RepID=A0A9W6VRM5_9ACTN|nr:xylulokinase [Actinoallomurus iriomotensis]GLY82433.1 xylulokinase [Actinoallomurus iriomotensis]